MATIAGFSRYEIFADGVVWCVSPQPARVLAICDNGRGYKTVTLESDLKVRARAYVHRLVLLAFVGVDPERRYANHKDGDKANNKLENLEWCTRSENMRHAVDVLGHFNWFGESHPGAKVTEDDVRAMRALRTKGALYREIAAEFGLNESWAYRIVTGQAWSHVR